MSNKNLFTQRTHSMTGIQGVVWRGQTTAAKETTMSVAPMYFIFAQKYLLNRDDRSQNTCVNLDRVSFFLSVKVK